MKSRLAANKILLVQLDLPMSCRLMGIQNHFAWILHVHLVLALFMIIGHVNMTIMGLNAQQITVLHSLKRRCVWINHSLNVLPCLILINVEIVQLQCLLVQQANV